MTPILFYGVPLGCSFGSIVALEWLGEPYRLCRVHMPDVSQGADYKAINPIGETPAFISGDGHVISEGLAIFHHVMARGLDKGLGFRQGTMEFDAFNRMMSFLVTRFFSAFNPLWFAYEFLDAPEKKAVLREEGTALVEAALGKLEALLGDRRWLVSDRMSMADAYYVGVARWVDFHSIIEWADFPWARALYDRADADPAVAFAHAIEAGEAPAGTGACQGHVALADIAAEVRAGRLATAAWATPGRPSPGRPGLSLAADALQHGPGRPLLAAWAIDGSGVGQPPPGDARDRSRAQSTCDPTPRLPPRPAFDRLRS